MEEKTVFFLFLKFNMFRDNEFIYFEKSDNGTYDFHFTKDYKEAYYFGEGLIELSDVETLDYILDFRILASAYLDSNPSSVYKMYKTFDKLSLQSTLVHLGIAKIVDGEVCEDSIKQAMQRQYMKLFTDKRLSLLEQFVC